MGCFKVKMNITIEYSEIALDARELSCVLKCYSQIMIYAQ